MDRKQFIEKFDPQYSAYLRDKVDQAKSYFEDDILKNAVERVYEIFGKSGKRVRPYTLYLMYKSAGGQKDEDSIITGIGLELEHVFALISDDICDRGEIRHGVQSIQEMVKEQLAARGITFDIEHQANCQAMLVSTLTLSWSYAALNPLNNPYKDRIISHFQEMSIKEVSGEMMDISFPARNNVADRELNKRDLFKTAADTFVYPLLLGAVLAGKEKELGPFSEKFGSLMGEVYQIQDDILDIVGEKGTPEYSDIREHQHTFLTQYVLSHGSDEDKKVLEKFFSGEEADQDNEKEVLDIVSKPDVIDYAKAESIKRIEQAKQELKKAGFASKYEALWFDIVGFFEKRFDSPA